MGMTVSFADIRHLNCDHWRDTSPAVNSWEPMETLTELDIFKKFLKKNHPEVQAGIEDSSKRKRKVQIPVDKADSDSDRRGDHVVD